MKDLHTHILPGMDDGAASTEMSIAMLKEECRQGVDAVALTPHFYPEREDIETFLSRREASFAALESAIAALSEEERRILPRLIPGAEAAWCSGMSQMADLEKLCYANTKLLLLELPFSNWTDFLFRELSEIISRRGLTPVIAHVDRYFSVVSKDKLNRLLSIGCPTQVSAEAFSYWFTRRKAMKLVRSGCVQMLISDCHNLASRRPDFEDAMKHLSSVPSELGEYDWLFETQ